MPNPALDKDMERYKLKIERKFRESFINHSFKFPKVEHSKPENILEELMEM